jgi:diaminopropionate ammonia-lyase
VANRPAVFRNPRRGRLPDYELADPDEVLDFHRRLPGYAPAPLVAAHQLGRELGLEKLWVKDESHRLGLPAFKMLGASWGTYQALRTRLGDRLGPWQTVAELRRQVAQLGPLTLATATDGNHGRAVARMAALVGLPARVYLPRSAGEVRIDALRQEGAAVIVVDGIYDEALERCVNELGPADIFASDADHRGEEGFARTVFAGYGTLIHESAQQLGGEGAPDVVVVQMGVGSLAASVIANVHRWSPRTAILGVEPADADCVLASLMADRLEFVPGPHRSQMVGLNCARPSDIAWPLLRAGLAAVVAVDDQWADRAMAALAGLGVESGHSGAAGLAGLMYLHSVGESLPGLVGNPVRSVLVINTEGATHLRP